MCALWSPAIITVESRISGLRSNGQLDQLGSVFQVLAFSINFPIVNIIIMDGW